jgi:serine/threonine protein kinase
MEFGGYIADSVIHTTNKCIILKGRPAESNFSKIVAIKLTSPTFKVFSCSAHHAMQAHYMEKLKHENMVIVLGAGTTHDGTSYVVMEYLPNGDIVSFCQNRGLTINERIRLFLQVCSGVEHMHKHMVVHSDLKPSNLLIDYNNVAKIIDLDLSSTTDKSFHEEFDFENLSGYTNKYASPEQLSTPFTVTTLSDIYSLSKVLLEILSGNSKFENTVLGTLTSNRHKLTNRLKELSAIIEKAGELKPRDRYQSIPELSYELKTYLEGKNVTTTFKKKASLAYKLNLFTRFHSYSIIFLALVFSIASSVFYLYISQMNKANSALLLMVESNNPTKVRSFIQFDHVGEELLNNSEVFTGLYFQKLISYGNAYLGKGSPEKAIAFFKKSKLLYADIESKNHIISVIGLAECYLKLEKRELANQLYSPYISLLYRKPLSTIESIQLFFSVVDNNIRLDKKFIDSTEEKSPAQVVQNINFDAIPDDEVKLELQIKAKLFNILDVYYSMYGDYANIIVFKDKEEFESEIKPQFNVIKRFIKEGYRIISDNAFQTHLELDLNLWEARIESEMGNHTRASELYNSTLAQYIYTYGSNHPKLVQVYSTGFAIFRFTNKDLALNFSKSIFSIAKFNNSVKQNTLMFYRWILADAYLGVGDWESFIKTINGSLEKYDQLERSDQTITDITSVANAVAMLTSLGVVYGDKIKKYYLADFLIGEIYGKALDMPFDVYSEVLRFRTKVDTLDEDKKISRLNKTYTNFVDNLTEELKENQISDVTLHFAELCSKITGCDARYYLDLADSQINWAPIQDSLSSYKLLWMIRKTNALINIKDYDLAKTILDKNKVLIDNLSTDTNLYFGLIKLLESEIQFGLGNLQTSEYIARKALPVLASNFGEDSEPYFRALKLLKTENKIY